eukprot:Nk52_evm1s20 gene=Nk52_evmTU1s20
MFRTILTPRLCTSSSALLFSRRALISSSSSRLSFSTISSSSSSAIPSTRLFSSLSSHTVKRCLPAAPVHVSKRFFHSTEEKENSNNSSVSEAFFRKNEKLNRPMSPFWYTLTSPSMTSWLSICHRGTGAFLTVVGSSWIIGCVATGTSWPEMIEGIRATQYPSGIIWLAKFGFGWAFWYHSVNGFRHLAWDFGKGFQLPDLYKSGYGVLGVSTALATITSML